MKRFFRNVWFAILYTFFNVVLFGLLYMSLDTLINEVKELTGWFAVMVGSLATLFTAIPLIILYYVGASVKLKGEGEENDSN